MPSRTLAIVSEDVAPKCIPCQTNARSMPGAPQVCTDVECIDQKNNDQRIMIQDLPFIMPVL